MATILCVDDDRNLTDIFCYALVREGYEVRVEHYGADALRAVRRMPPDLVLLDAILPDMTGLEVVTGLRAVSKVAVIMVSAQASEEAMLQAYGLGIDDYVAKPFNMQVLMCRVGAVLRRSRYRPATPSLLRYELGDVLFHPDTTELIGRDGRQAVLTPAENQILHLLVMHDGYHLSTDDLAAIVRGREAAGSPAAIKTHVRHLRAKLATLPGETDVIVTDRGQGYRVRAVRAIEDLVEVPVLVETA